MWTLFGASYARSSKKVALKRPSEGDDLGCGNDSIRSNEALTSSIEVEVVNTIEKGSGIVQLHSLSRNGLWING
jgi:hypothetical protein